MSIFKLADTNQKQFYLTVEVAVAHCRFRLYVYNADSCFVFGTTTISGKVAKYPTTSGYCPPSWILRRDGTLT